MANIKVIAEHSVDTDLLTGGICIDVGCRGFGFSEAMRDLGCTVMAYDLDELDAPEGIRFHKAAITKDGRFVSVVDTKDIQAKHILGDGRRTIGSLSLSELFKSNKDRSIDVLKLDCEGTEYELLSDPNFQPIPQQITVEFHEHAHKQLHDQYFEACMENLNKHYIPVKHERYAAHGAGMNYWDSLFVRRELMNKQRQPKPNEAVTSIKTR